MADETNNQPEAEAGEPKAEKAPKKTAAKAETAEPKVEKAPEKTAPIKGEGKGAAEPKAEKAEGKKAGKGEKTEAKAAGKKVAAAKGKAEAKKPAAPARATRAGRAKQAEPSEGATTGATATARYVRMAPRKLRLVADAIRGKKVQEARGILQFCGKRAAGPLAKVLNSAVANAENNHHMSTDDLYVATLFVDQGPSHKSFIPRARGRASAVHKFTSHITIVVKEREEV